MAWIESHQELQGHPKTIALASLMDWSLNEAIGSLHRFWWWCLKYAEDGDLRRYNDAVLASTVGLDPRDGQRFVEAMVKCGGEAASGFLERSPYFRVHDWWDYAGRFLQVKYKHNPDRFKGIAESYKNPPKNRSKNHKPNLTKPNLTKPKNSLVSAPPDEAMNIARVLRALILRNNPNALVPDDGGLVAWGRQAELLLRVDKRDSQEAMRVLQWCQDDPFWKCNILGVVKFRKQYDQLKLKMSATPRPSSVIQPPKQSIGTPEDCEYCKLCREKYGTVGCGKHFPEGVLNG